MTHDGLHLPGDDEARLLQVPEHAVHPLPVDPDLAPDDRSEPAETHRPAFPRVHRTDPAILALIALGGFLGTLARYEVGLVLPAAAGAFPTATFVVNVSGSLVLALVLTTLLERRPHDRHLRPFACVGVLGAWTTMSTLAVESDVLVHGDHLVMAAAYLVATVAASLAATVIGTRLALRATGGS